MGNQPSNIHTNRKPFIPTLQPSVSFKYTAIASFAECLIHCCILVFNVCLFYVIATNLKFGLFKKEWPRFKYVALYAL